MIDVFRFLLSIAFTLFGAALLMRAWMHGIRMHPFNPVARVLIQYTEWLVRPLRKVFPVHARFDWASLFGTWLTALLYLVLLILVVRQALPTLDMLPLIAGMALATMCKWALNLIIWLTLAQAILSWINPLAPIMPVLTTVTAPLLDPIRRIMPKTGGMDFSPLVLLVIAQVGMMLLVPYTGQ